MRNGRAAIRVNVGQNFTSRLIPKSGVAFKAVHDDAGEPIRQIRFQEFRIFRLFFYTLIHHLPGGFAGERNVAGHHLVHDQSERIEIAAMIDRSAFDLFGRHVARSSDKSTAASHAHFRGLERSGEAKIGNKHLIVFADQDVVWFEVAMNDAFGMRGVKGVAHLSRKFKAAVDRQQTFLFQDSVEIFTVHESHGDELDAVGFTQVVDAKNVFVRNSAGKQEFVFEALNDLRIAGKIRQQDLQRGVTIELTVVDFVNAAHPAFTEQRLDDETRTKFFAGTQNS